MILIYLTNVLMFGIDSI